MKFFLLNKNFNFSSAIFLQNYFSRKGIKNIVLCGGNTVKQIYNKINFHCLKRRFYLSDERYVQIQSCFSNSLHLKELISKKNFFFPKIYKNYEHTLLSYEKKLPNNLDLAVVSYANDGHFFSIFPHKKKIICYSDRLIVVRPQNKILRISINLETFNTIKEKFFIIKDVKRLHNLLDNIFKKKGNFRSLNLTDYKNYNFLLHKNCEKYLKNKKIGYIKV